VLAIEIIMKISIFYFIIISLFLILVSSGCEKAEIQKSLPNDIGMITPRIDDCEECPNEDDCCCFVELYNNDDDAYLRFCGTTDGPDACLGSFICGSAFSGGGQDIVLLDPTNPRQPFCMAEGAPFRILNYHSTDVAYINITCQGKLINPQIIPLELDPGEYFFYETNSSCYLSLCP